MRLLSWPWRAVSVLLSSMKISFFRCYLCILLAAHLARRRAAATARCRRPLAALQELGPRRAARRAALNEKEASPRAASRCSRGAWQSRRGRWAARRRWTATSPWSRTEAARARRRRSKGRAKGGGRRRGAGSGVTRGGGASDDAGRQSTQSHCSCTHWVCRDRVGEWCQHNCVLITE